MSLLRNVTFPRLSGLRFRVVVRNPIALAACFAGALQALGWGIFLAHHYLS